jgi:uncharacterized protein (TIGR02118 family)
VNTGRSRIEAQHYWAETHGRLVANSPTLRRYHHYFSLHEAYQGQPKPTFIGTSMFWRDNSLAPAPINDDPTLDDFTRFYRNQPGGSDDRQLFDRERRWPIHDQHADILGEEHVIVEGETKPSMVNAIFMVRKLPGLDHRDFCEHWLDVHAGIAVKLPGLRRYIVNPVVPESLATGTSTHDGWSELWFDDYVAFQKAYRSPQWAAMEEDGATMFYKEKGIVIGREYVQKDENWKPRDYGALSMTEEEIRARLLKEGYKSLSADPAVAKRIKEAAASGKLAVWTPEHIAACTNPPIDARPQR